MSEHMSLSYQDLQSAILNDDGYLDPESAKLSAPNYCGVYSIRVRELNSLPKDVITHQKEVSYDKNILYVGMANPQFLSERLIRGDLGGGTAIFFRKLGSVLGHIAVPSSKNYRFEKESKRSSLRWIDKNIKVKYFRYPISEYSEAETRYQFESPLIELLKPSFNYQHNPQKCDYVTWVHLKNREIGLSRHRD